MKDSTPPICNHPQCDNECRMKTRDGYAKHCSISCQNSQTALNSSEKRKNTCLAKYGVSNPSKSKQVIDKIKQSKLDRHGDSNYNNTIKRDNTNLIKYGNKNALSTSNTRDKRKNTMINRYGTEHALQNANINEKYRATIAGLDYTAINEKRKTTCILNLGVNYPAQSQKVQEVRRDNSIKNYARDHSSKYHISEIALTHLQDKAWLENEYSTKSLFDISSDLGISNSHLHLIFARHGIRVIRKQNSNFEKEVGAFIAQSLGYEIETNDRTIIGPQELDIVVLGTNIAIECNGIYWHSELHGKVKSYHIDKTTSARSKNIDLIHISDHDWIYKTDIVKSRLTVKLGKANRIYARKCDIRLLSINDEKQFLNETHIQGYNRSHIAFGLYYDNELCSVMSVARSRFGGIADVEMLRFSSKLNTVVIGGMSKLFNHIIQEMSFDKMVSYSDSNWGSGGSYSKLGFKFTHNTPPNYHYFKKNSPDILYNRMTFQKHKLEEMLDIFDPALTEWQNMVNNGYDRIWNTGNSAWIYNNKKV